MDEDNLVLEDSLILDDFAPGDAAVLCAADHDPDHRRWFDFPPDFAPTLEHSQAVITRWEHERREGSRYTFAVRDAATKELLGGCEVRPRQENPANVSYWTFPAHRRQGVASRAVALLRLRAFGELGLRCLEAIIDPENIGSVKVVLRNGFQEAGRREGKLVYVCTSNE
jgi:[ribosomal protein S5]-alanine N-acetyltransferase